MKELSLSENTYKKNKVLFFKYLKNIQKKTIIIKAVISINSNL